MSVQIVCVILAAGFLLAVNTPAEAASVHRDSYEPAVNEEPNIEDNLVENEDEGVEGLYPPKASAQDYYHAKSIIDLPQTEAPNPEYTSSKYVIDTVNKVLRLQQEDATAETKLSPAEEEEIKKMSAAFWQLLTTAKLENADWDSQTTASGNSTEEEETPQQDEDYWKSLNPVITFSDSGLSISFVNNNVTENSTEAVSTGRSSQSDEDKLEPTADQLRESLWTYLSQSIDKLLEEELERVSNDTDITEAEESSSGEVFITTAEPETGTTQEGVSKEDQTAVSLFVDSVWNLMRSSVEYFGSLFNGNSGAEVTTSTISAATPTDAATSTTDAATSATAAATSTTDAATSTTAAATSTTAAANSATEARTTEGQPRASSASTSLFAFEEPLTYHRFPSQEFEKRGRDIDSLLYGHGIV